MFVAKGEGTLRDTYKIGKVLGEGAFGEVRLCTHRESGDKRAVKVLRKDAMDEEETAAMLKLSKQPKKLVPMGTATFYYFSPVSA